MKAINYLDELLARTEWVHCELHPAEMSRLHELLLELKAYREGGITEEILRRNDGYIKVGRGCMIVAEL